MSRTDLILFQTIMQIDGEEASIPRIVVNVAYSYAVIMEAATRVQQLFQGVENPSVTDLKFSPHWVRGFLNRANMRRR